MNWFRNLTIAWKLLVCFGFVIVCLASVTFWINGIIKQNEKEGDYALSARSLRNNANRMRLAMLTMELA
ncbi:MAG TPA: hypothetical protein V6D22_24865, partial [Candidatus Obscuribacterales bacterium]